MKDLQQSLRSRDLLLNKKDQDVRSAQSKEKALNFRLTSMAAELNSLKSKPDAGSLERKLADLQRQMGTLNGELRTHKAKGLSNSRLLTEKDSKIQAYSNSLSQSEARQREMKGYARVFRKIDIRF